MRPTYSPGARVRVSRLLYLLRPPSRGDVVVIRSPGSSDRLEVKRIIGLPNEEIAWDGGRFCVNGTWLAEPYATVPPRPPGDDEVSTRQTGSGEYFVAGDNRLYSHDSRRYGPIHRSAILGKVLS